MVKVTKNFFAENLHDRYSYPPHYFGGNTIWSYSFMIIWEEMMLETSLRSVDKIKKESLFFGGRKSKTFFEYLIGDWLSSAIIETVEKCLIKVISYSN